MITVQKTRSSKVKNLKAGSIFLRLKSSIEDNMRCGVYHTTEYIVVTTTGYLVVCGSHDGDEYDIDDKRGHYYGLSDSWEPEWHPSNSTEYSLEPNEKELIVPVTYEHIQRTSPRIVLLLIRAARYGMEKALENK